MRRPRDEIARHEKRRAESQRRRHDQPMIGADEQPHQVRHDDADEADGPPIDTAAPVASDALKKASRCTRSTSTPRAAA